MNNNDQKNKRRSDSTNNNNNKTPKVARATREETSKMLENPPHCVLHINDAVTIDTEPYHHIPSGHPGLINDADDDNQACKPAAMLLPLPRPEPIHCCHNPVIDPPKISHQTTTFQTSVQIDDAEGESHDKALIPPERKDRTRNGPPSRPTEEEEEEEDRSKKSSSKDEREVGFLVGKGRQLMSGRDSQLAAISPVFCAMVSERWRRCGSTGFEAEIPDVEPDTFAVILRCSQGDDLQLTEDNVWHVLKAADMYQVWPVVKECFHFLLHHHPCRRRSRHLCAVLEMAHQLGYMDVQYEECLAAVQQKARQVFRNMPALSELCQQCMLRLIQLENLAVPEIWIHGAVVRWAHHACAKRGEATPSLEMLREVAGDLIYHVRYLALPRRMLGNLENKHGRIVSLLTDEELHHLLKGDVRNFPDTISVKRRNQHGQVALCDHKRFGADASIVFLCAFILLLLFAFVYFPVIYIAKHSQTDH